MNERKEAIEKLDKARKELYELRAKRFNMDEGDIIITKKAGTKEDDKKEV